jgi:hypothetical protein
MKAGRNDPCPCGSGEKYKRCCAEKEPAKQFRPITILAGFIVALVVAGAVVAFVTMDPEDAPPGKVWSPEHLHWHDVKDAPAPPGPAPPGKVWSKEHGHWHDVAGATSEGSTASTAQPPGPAPPGKVWSAEHGHWHDQ